MHMKGDVAVAWQGVNEQLRNNSWYDDILVLFY